MHGVRSKIIQQAVNFKISRKLSERRMTSLLPPATSSRRQSFSSKQKTLQRCVSLPKMAHYSSKDTRNGKVKFEDEIITPARSGSDKKPMQKSTTLSEFNLHLQNPRSKSDDESFSSPELQTISDGYNCISSNIQITIEETEYNTSNDRLTIGIKQNGDLHTSEEILADDKAHMLEKIEYLSQQETELKD